MLQKLLSTERSLVVCFYTGKTCVLWDSHFVKHYAFMLYKKYWWHFQLRYMVHSNGV